MSLFSSLGRTVYQLGFQISPIIFTGGIADQFGGYLPIVALTEAANFLTGILSGSDVFDLDRFFAHFTPISGGKLASFSIGQYPFANQSVAANAIIFEPLQLSLRMSIPVNKSGGHTAKLVTMMALKAAIAQHAQKGGTYTIATPAFLYTNCLLTGLTDVSSGDSPIPQNTYQWDFTQPLITLQAAQAAQNTLMGKIGGGLPTSGTLNSVASSAGVPSTITGTVAKGVGIATSYANTLNPLNAL